MAGKRLSRLPFAALPVLYLLHNDLWLWDDPAHFLGLPIGLTYHILFSAAVVLTMWWLVRRAWPAARLHELATGGTGATSPEDDG